MNLEAPVEAYDRMHASYGAPAAPVESSFYYPLFRRVADEVANRKPQAIIEVGSGNGWLAKLLTEKREISYRGFDFSPVAVRNAQLRLGRDDMFTLGDAQDAKNYNTPYDAIVCTEVLEHIERDLDVIRLWQPGALCFCTVPNFDYKTHVRYFRHESEVYARFGHLIDIDMIVRVSRPIFRGKTPSRFVRDIRWSRNNPKKVLGMMGINTFEWYAGWFLFVGRRRG